MGHFFSLDANVAIKLTLRSSFQYGTSGTLRSWLFLSSICKRFQPFSVLYLSMNSGGSVSFRFGFCNGASPDSLLVALLAGRLTYSCQQHAEQMAEQMAEPMAERMVWHTVEQIVGQVMKQMIVQQAG